MSLLIIFTWQWSFDCQAVGVNVCSFSLLKWLSAVSRTAVNLLIMSVCFNIIWLPPIYSFFSLELQLRHFIYCKFCVFVCKHGLKGQQIVPFLSFPFNSFPFLILLPPLSGPSVHSSAGHLRWVHLSWSTLSIPSSCVGGWISQSSQVHVSSSQVPWLLKERPGQPVIIDSYAN